MTLAEHKARTTNKVIHGRWVQVGTCRYAFVARVRSTVLHAKKRLDVIAMVVTLHRAIYTQGPH